MDARLMIIVGAFALLMVLLGGNPVEEAKEKAEAERLAGGDPLVTSIKEHNARGGMGSFGNPLGGDANTLPGGYPGYARGSIGAYNPNGSVPAYRPQRAPGSGTPDSDSYYPPPALYETQQPRQGVGAPRSYNNQLPDGRAVYFMGTNVYTLDEGGRRVPVPDGVYARLGGRINMYVKDGRKVSASN